MCHKLYNRYSETIDSIEPNFKIMMHSSDEDIKLCSVDRYFLQKYIKIIKKFVKVDVWFAVTKSNLFD